MPATRWMEPEALRLEARSGEHIGVAVGRTPCAVAVSPD